MKNESELAQLAKDAIEQYAESHIWIGQKVDGTREAHFTKWEVAPLNELVRRARAMGIEIDLDGMLRSASEL